MSELADFLGPTSIASAVGILAVGGFLVMGGGEAIFGGPSAHESRYMRAQFHDNCIRGGGLALDSEYCRTHNMDGSAMSAEEIARRDRADAARESSRPVTSASKPSAAERADFEAILKEASR